MHIVRAQYLIKIIENSYFRMILRFCIVATYILQAAKSDIMESTGFHCKNANSMRLDRKLHGSPHLTIPPFEFTVLDEDGNYVEYYEPGVNYRSKRSSSCDSTITDFMVGRS